MGQQLWVTNSLGGFLGSDELSKKVRHAAQTMQRFRQFTDPEGAHGKNSGDTVLFDKISNIATGGGTLVETSTIPKSNFTITQGSLVVAEWGNSIPNTLKAKTLAEVSLPDAITTVLRNDMAKVLDSEVASHFQTSDYKATITNTATTTFASAGTAAASAGANMSDKNVRDIIDKMKILNIPKINGEYVSINSTNSLRGLYDFFEAKAQNTTMSPLAIGEVGKYYGCRFIEETNVLSNVLGTYYGESVFFGADAVREGIVIPEEIRMDIPKDFGRDQATAWYALLGFVKTWDFSADGETRIIHVTST
jgi:N4-gp56 family major capsid protein